MDQVDVNSQTRADCHGMRPDLYAVLSGAMVRKDDLTTIGGTLGYANVRLAGNTPLSIPSGVSTRISPTIVGESKGVSVVDLNGRSPGLLMDTGVWIVSQLVTTWAPGKTSYDLEITNGWAQVSTGTGVGDATVTQIVNVPFVRTRPRGTYSGTFITVAEGDDVALVPSIYPYADGVEIYNSTMSLLRIA